MGHVNESIWSNDKLIIPMAEVSHIEKDTRKDFTEAGCSIIFKHSKWNEQTQSFEPMAYLLKSEMNSFIRDWCMYRRELEIETLAEINN